MKNYLKLRKKYFDIFFKKVNDIWSKNIIDERKMDKQIENILINVKATKSENEHIKKLLKLVYLKEKKINSNILLAKMTLK